MTNYYVTYTLKDKKTRDKFYSEVKASGVVEASRAEEGCIRYDYFFHADTENQIFLWEQWDSRDAQAEHMKLPHFATLSAIKEKYNAVTDILVEDQQIR